MIINEIVVELRIYNYKKIKFLLFKKKKMSKAEKLIVNIFENSTRYKHKAYDLSVCKHKKDSIIIGGGFTKDYIDRELNEQVWKLNRKTMKYSQLFSNCFVNCIFEVNNKLFLFSNNELNERKKLYIFDGKNVETINLSLEIGLFNCVTITKDNQFIHSLDRKHLRLNTTTYEVKELKMPPVKCLASKFINGDDKNLLYLFPGMSQDIYCFNIKQNKWNKIYQISDKYQRYCYEVVRYFNFVVMICGEVPTGTNYKFLNEILIFDLHSNEMIKQNKIYPFGASNISGTLIGNKIYCWWIFPFR